MRFAEASSACNRKYCPERTERGRRGAGTDDEPLRPLVLGTHKESGAIAIDRHLRHPILLVLAVEKASTTKRGERASGRHSMTVLIA
jgi:hypothetical protein